jgi:anti-sigma regulatory factor (Ser/Thr protein kinase)
MLLIYTVDVDKKDSEGSAMVTIRKRGAEIRQFILEHVEQHPGDIALLTARTFEMSRQAVHRHLRSLLQQHALCVLGTTRARRYSLAPLVQWTQIYPLATIEAEDRVWRQEIRPLLGTLPDNVLQIWSHGFTEIVNNAMEHSSGHEVRIHVTKTAVMTDIMIADDGEGIFTKIQRELGLEDARHAVLELAKGKLTTDPAHHTGEGIFFASRMFDDFSILSGNVYFSYLRQHAQDWILEQQTFQEGTSVSMRLKNNSSRTTKEVFDAFTSGDEYGFTKTVVPVRLARYGDEQLISRSQAKRLLARIDRFKMVVLDFAGVDMIGQAFADEVFRVFQNDHPHIALVPFQANSLVQQMITRATHQETELRAGLEPRRLRDLGRRPSET